MRLNPLAWVPPLSPLTQAGTVTFLFNVTGKVTRAGA